jgi:peptidyl-prolyl cis-trans isomerase C
MTQFFRTQWACVPIVAVILLTACSKGQQAAAPAAPPAGDKTAAAPPVATVNGTPISRAVYDIYMKSLLQGKPNTDLTPEQKSQILDDLIKIQLIAAQGEKDGVQNDPEVAARMQIVKMRIEADAESQNYLKDKVPTDAELHAEYDAQIATMDKTEYHARHILVPTKELAEQLIKKIQGGAKFEEVAKANSTDGSKTNGGDLGWFTLARMVKPFGDAVKGLKKGEITTQPVQTQFGWHIIKLEDTREVTPPPFDQVKAQLNNGVLQKKLQAYVDDLKKTAVIDKKPPQ